MGPLLIIILIPVLIVALVISYGRSLPPGHIAVRRVSYAAAPETIWRVITDWERFPMWRKDLTAISRLADRNGRPVWRELRKNGPLTSEIVEVDPDQRRMVTRIVDERAFGGTWTWEVKPSGSNESTLTITEAGEIYNWMFRIVNRFSGPYGTMDALHRDLKAMLGEPPPNLPRGI